MKLEVPSALTGLVYPAGDAQLSGITIYASKIVAQSISSTVYGNISGVAYAATVSGAHGYGISGVVIGAGGTTTLTSSNRIVAVSGLDIATDHAYHIVCNISTRDNTLVLTPLFDGLAANNGRIIESYGLSSYQVATDGSMNVKYPSSGECYAVEGIVINSTMANGAIYPTFIYSAGFSGLTIQGRVFRAATAANITSFGIDGQNPAVLGSGSWVKVSI